jgi:xanthine dehydrogenase YagR molybdenum-binding subunit
VMVEKVVAIQACGRIVSRKTAESQIIGGVIQGISFALFEERVLDRERGAMLNANMEWYRILGSRDMPHIEPILWDDGGTGVRPLGEPPVIPTAGAIGAAVADAIGVPVRSLPITPARVLAAVAAAEGGAA